MFEHDFEHDQPVVGRNCIPLIPHNMRIDKIDEIPRGVETVLNKKIYLKGEDKTKNVLKYRCIGNKYEVTLQPIKIILSIPRSHYRI